MAPLLDRASAALAALLPALPGLVPEDNLRKLWEQALTRGYFRPNEEIPLFSWFARLLTARGALAETILELEHWLGGVPKSLESKDEWRCFLIGYSAACMLVRLDRLLVEEVALHTDLQRKLNEGNHAHRIPRKQYTTIFKSLTEVSNAWRMYQAMRFVRKHGEQLDALNNDPMVGFLARHRKQLEAFLDPSKTNYLKRVLSYRDHSARRRGASSLQQSTFALLSLGGRAVSELNPGWIEKRVSPEVRHQLASILQPGDVLTTRHQYAATNLFLPGYWPHAALYVGTPQQRDAWGIKVPAPLLQQWTDDICVLEALKDGVRLRPLKETLGVDAVAVIRPRLAQESIARGIERVLEHEGKGYNFDFDFFRSDRLVCTEVVYRAFDGIGEMHIPLTERAGRHTLAAEDLLDLALVGELFEPIAIYGTESSPQLIRGLACKDVLKESYQKPLIPKDQS